MAGPPHAKPQQVPPGWFWGSKKAVQKREEGVEWGGNLRSQPPFSPHPGCRGGLPASDSRRVCPCSPPGPSGGSYAEDASLPRGPAPWEDSTILALGQPGLWRWVAGQLS